MKPKTPLEPIEGDVFYARKVVKFGHGLVKWVKSAHNRKVRRKAKQAIKTSCPADTEQTQIP